MDHLEIDQCHNQYYKSQNIRNQMKTRPRWIVAREDKEEESLWLRGGANLEDKKDKEGKPT